MFQLQFHVQQPDHMFSSSENGDIWHWNGSAVNRVNFGNQFPSSSSSSSAPENPTQCLWFNNDAVKHRVETGSLMARQSLPINSLDSLGSALLVGGDNEAVYLLSNVI